MPMLAASKRGFLWHNIRTSTAACLPASLPACQPAFCLVYMLYKQRQTTIAARFIRKIQSSDKMKTTTVKTGAEIHVIRVRLFVSFCCRRFSDSFASFPNLNSALLAFLLYFFCLIIKKLTGVSAKAILK